VTVALLVVATEPPLSCVLGATGFLVEPDHLGLESLAALAEEGRLRVVVDETFPLERAAEAHEYLQSGKPQGKVVLTTHPS
jgi:NADPH:quinone reductase-like Zn-dependent oxidoreductase